MNLWKTKKAVNIEEIKMQWYAAMVVVMASFAQMQMTYADNTFFNKAKAAVDTVYDQLFGIVTPLFGLIAIICMIVIGVTPGRSFEKAMTWLVRLVAAYLGILCLGWIVSFLQSLTTGGQL